MSDIILKNKEGMIATYSGIKVLLVPTADSSANYYEGLVSYENELTLTDGLKAIARTNIAALSAADVFDLIYPVGAIYLSVSETNPGILFGGTWELIKDTFLLSAGDTYTAGSTGGEATHTLTVAEMPSHSHGTLSTNNGATSTLSYSSDVYYTNWTNVIADGYPGTKNSGSSEAHNNLPPYLVVYAWKRLS